MRDIEEVLKSSRTLSMLYISKDAKGRELFETFFHHVECAAGTSDAIKLYAAHKELRGDFHDLVVIDATLGPSPCRAILERNPDQSCAIIAEDAGQLEPFLSEGIPTVIPGNFEIDAFTETLYSICKEIECRHRLQRLGHEHETLLNEHGVMRAAYEMKLEEAHAEVKRKSDFLAGMSHEIRTPMNAVMGLGQLLLDEALSEKGRDYVEKINASAEMLLTIINDILDYSKIEVGKLQLESVEFDMNMILDHVADMVGLKVQEKRLELVFDIDHGIRPLYIGDPTRIGQIILNLIGNAVKFTAEGGITLHLHALQTTSERQMLQFDVIDTGIGMDESETGRLFQEYVQATDATTRKYGGTGLGLAICKQLVELMQGRIWVQSEPGVGSTFSFVVELGIANPQERRVYHLPSKALMQQRILIVDAHEYSADALNHMLGYFHMGVERCSTVTEAIERLERRSYDMLFIDQEMYRLCDLDRFSQKEAPVVVLLASRINELQPDMRGEGQVDAYLRKPFNQQMLFNVFMELYGGGATLQRLEKARLTKEDLKPLAGNRVLVAEDNLINQKVMQGLFEQSGIEIEIARDGAEALKAVKERGPYDLVLMDIHMPVMDGYESTLRIRESCDAEQLPIIALTADAMAEDVKKATDHGMQEHLAKPIEVGRLYELLLHYLHAKEEAQETCGAVTDEEEMRLGYRLAEIPELDYDGGVERSGGSCRFYLSLLQDFMQMFGDSVSRLHQYAERRAYREGEHYAHYIKGSAANIGHKGLFRVTKELEQTFREEEGEKAVELATEYADLYTAFSDQLRGIAAIEPQNTRAPLWSPVQEGLLKRLLEASRNRRVLECIKAIEELRSQKWPKSQHKALYEVIRSLKKYRFDEAAVRLEAMGIA